MGTYAKHWYHKFRTCQNKFYGHTSDQLVARSFSVISEIYPNLNMAIKWTSNGRIHCKVFMSTGQIWNQYNTRKNIDLMHVNKQHLSKRISGGNSMGSHRVWPVLWISSKFKPFSMTSLCAFISWSILWIAVSEESEVIHSRIISGAYEEQMETANLTKHEI